MWYFFYDLIFPIDVKFKNNILLKEKAILQFLVIEYLQYNYPKQIYSKYSNFIVVIDFLGSFHYF